MFARARFLLLAAVVIAAVGCGPSEAELTSMLADQRAILDSLRLDRKAAIEEHENTVSGITESISDMEYLISASDDRLASVQSLIIDKNSEEYALAGKRRRETISGLKTELRQMRVKSEIAIEESQKIRDDKVAEIDRQIASQERIVREMAN